MSGGKLGHSIFLVMVKNKGYITLVRIVVLVTFFLTIVLDHKSDAKETLYARLSRSKNQITNYSSLKLLADSSLLIAPPAAKNKLFSSPLHPGNSDSPVYIRYNFYTSKIQPFIVFTSPAKIRGIHPINGPPDRLSSSGNTEHQPLNVKASNQSPADSCIQIPNSVLSVFSETPLLLAALPGREFSFLVRNEGSTTLRRSAGQAPVLECPEDISTYTDINDCSAFVSGGLNPGFDESEVVTLTWEMEGAMEDASPRGGINVIDDYTFDEGTTIITYTATGTDGTTATCIFTVTISDNQVPRLESIPADITVETAPGTCYARVYWIEPTAIDNCTSPHLIRKESTNRPGDEFPVGTTRVYYTAYDAMGNESQVHSFAVTVRDTEAPELSLPADVTLECGSEITAPWQTLQQLNAAGGFAADNCSDEEISFRLLTETTSSPVCPYVLTRTYQATDAAGNNATATHRIVVTGTQPADAVVTEPEEEEVRLKSGMAAIISTATGGAWNDPNTWVGGIVPDPDDDVTIASGATVTVDDVTIDGSLTLENGASLEVSGNWTNNGSFSAGTNSNVTFTGTTSPVSIGGTSTTVFKNFELDKGSGNVLEVNSNIELDGTITFTSGIMQINSGVSVICTHNAGFTIEEDAGMVIAGGTFTSGAFTVTNRGLFQIDSGTVNIGTVSGNSLFVGSDGTFLMNNGTLNVAGRLQISGGTATVNGGTINLNTVGHNSSTIATLDLSLSSDFNMTGGTINFLNPNGTGYLDVSILNGVGGNKSFTGGTFNFGTGVSETYKLSSQVPFPNYTLASNTDIILRIPVSSNGTYNFPLTTSSGNSIPATITISGTNYTNAYIEIATFGEKHPDNANTTNHLNRYWTITTSGITNPAYDVTVSYVSTDMAGTESAIAAGLWTGSLPWQKGNVASSNTITFSGITANSAEITGITLAPPTVEINGGNASETICNDGTSSVTLTAVATGDFPFSYSWSPAAGLSATDISNPDASPAATTTYTVEVTDGNGFTATDDIEVIVDPVSVAGTAGTDQAICFGNSPSDITLLGYTGTIQWQSSPDGATNWTDISGSTNATLTGAETGNLTSTTYYRAEVASGVCPPDYSNTVTITVDPESIGGTAASDQTICFGSAPADITLSGYTGIVQWQSSPDGTSNWTDISGSTNATLTGAETGTLTSTTYYRAEVTSGVCSPDYSNTVTITVDPESIGGTAASDQTICFGSAPADITLSGYTGTIQWQSSPDGTSNWTDISGANNAILTGAETGNLTSTTYYRAEVSSGICPPDYSNTVAITVDPQTEAGTASATNSVICSGETTTLNLAGYTGTIQWQQSADGTTGWANVSGGSGATTDDYTTPALTETTFYRALVTSGVCTDIASNTVEITVNTPPVITECPALPLIVNTDPGVCSAVVNYTVTASGSPAPDYSWEFSGATVAAGSGTGSGSAFNKGITNVTVTATNSCGTVTCEFTIEVEDNEAPVQPTIASVTEQCAYDPATYPTTTDNCDGIIFGTPSVTFPYTTTGVSTIIWTFTDSEGNSSTANQVITINDTQSPTWVTFPADVTVECGEDTSPAARGVPTATDNCSDVTITYNDIVEPGNCPARSLIIRTWEATDATGNYVIQNQRIRIDDTTPPVISCESYINFDPDDVPLIDDFFGVTVSDNCTAPENITIIPISEEYEFDNNVPGFCPTFLTRVYRAYDECGNYSDCVQTFDFTFNPDCELCEDGTRFFQHIFTSPDETWDIESVTRQGNCCNQSGSPPLRCVAYNFYLHEDAVGVIFRASEGAKPPSGNFYTRIDCGPPVALNQTICLQGGRFYTVTFCKSGGNPNSFSIESISGATTTEDLVTRNDNDCSGQISVEGLDPNEDITWSVKFPNNQSLLNYLDLTDPLNPIFTADGNAPPVIIYEVCGTLLGNYVCDGQPVTDCAEVTVTVLPAIEISFDIDLDDICEDDIPDIYVDLTPLNYNYIYEWYDSNGNLISTLEYLPKELVEEGDYTLVVSENESGILCNSASHDFTITFDYIGPSILAPPDDLILDCNDPDTEIIIAQWLALATASDGNMSSIPVYNDYSPFTHYCNAIVPVEFWAQDVCNNISNATANIIISDVMPPEMISNAVDKIVECDGAGNITELNNWLDSNGGAIAVDECGDVIWTNDFTALSDLCGETGAVTVIFTATDECGNSVTTQAVFTIEDNMPPIFTFCPPPVTNVADPDLCLILDIVLESPVASDNCDTPIITWVKTGDTEGSGTGTVTGPFNVGVTLVTYTATDDCGNTATCTQEVTIEDAQDPVIIECPQDVTVTAPPPNCELEVIEIDDLIVTDNCNHDDLIWYWEKTGATVASGTGNVNNTLFNVGVTTVTYTVEDRFGNTATCSFTVTVNDEVPPIITECIDDIIEVDADEETCDALVELSIPIAYDPCGQEFTIAHNSDYLPETFDPEALTINGRFPVGNHTVIWTVLDASGNVNASCVIEITVNDTRELAVSCPSDLTEFADFGELYASGVSVGVPTIQDNCYDSELSWVMVPPVDNLADPPVDYADYYTSEQLSGTGIFTGTGTYWLGVTTITYTLTDEHGNSVSCQFTVTVLAAPDIECAEDIEEAYNDENECSALLDPGVPTLVQGAHPIVWTYTITWPDGTSETTVVFDEAVEGVYGPPQIGEIDFPVGTTTIYWTATNAAGSDDCTQSVTIIDNEDPTAELPDPLNECVENLFLAQYNGDADNLTYNPDYPHPYAEPGNPDGGDYYLFKLGDERLDITNYLDNCCDYDPDNIQWVIEFDGSEPDISGNGLPSEYGEIKLWGDGVDFENRHHTIIYTISDCNGNEITLEPIEITIRPRPNIIKVTE